MSSKHLHGDTNYAWPGAEVALMGAKGAFKILYGRKADPKSIAKHTAKCTERFANPMVVAQRGFIDDIIDPEQTRKILCNDLFILKKNACIPTET
jgi:propionyl-CoA carboxylase beta chain